MWDGMIRMVTDVRYVPDVQKSLMSLNELNSRGYGLRIRGGSIEILCGDMDIIRGGSIEILYEMVGTVVSAATVVSAGNPT
jgi:hypothetical protein